MSELETERSKKYVSVRLTVSMTPVIFPIDFADLTQALKNKQYEVPVEVLPAGIGRRVGGAGIIARKGQTSVIADSDRRFIGVDASSPKDVLSYFEKLTQILKDDLWVDVYSEAAYFELSMRLHVLARANPTAAIETFFQNLETLSVLESIIGEPASLFTIRLVPKEKLPGDKEWFDIRIEPDVSRPGTAFMVEIVYRKAQYKGVKKFIGAIDQKIDAILDSVE